MPEDKIGTFHLAAYADIAEGAFSGVPADLPEIDESNNLAFSAAFRIAPAPQPDLVATNIRFEPGDLRRGGPVISSSPSAAPSTGTFQATPIFSGQLLSVSWRTENQGDGPTDGFTEKGIYYPGSSHWRSEVYLSPTNDPTVDPGRDIFLRELDRTRAALGPGEAEGVGNLQERVAADLHGSWYVKVRLDTLDQVSELGGESNNVGVSPVPVEIILSVPVDLVPTAISGPALGIPGHLAHITWSAMNAGPRGDFPLAWKDAVYLSLDDTLDASDIRLGEAAMASPGNSGAGGADTLGYLPPYTRSLDFRVPNDTPAGTYRLLVSADDGNDIFELPEGEANNVLESAAPIEIQLLPTDLTPQAGVDPDHPLPASGAPGTAIDIAWQVTNTGSVATPVSAWFDRVLLSPTPSLAGEPLIQLADFKRQAALDAGASYALSHTATVPYIAPGDYYLLFSTDSENAVYEQAPGEDNNLLAVPFRVTSDVADLAVKQVTAPAAGNTVQVEWTVVNDGAKPTSAAAWVDDVYLSRDKTLDDADIHLGSRERTGTEVLAPGAGYTVNATFQLPVLGSGLYYLIVKADTLDDVFETELGNNLAVVPLPVNVQVADLPNLRPTGISAPARVNAGQTLDLAWTERNIGGGTTDEQKWPSSVFLSRDRYLDRFSDTYLGQVEVDHALAAGEGMAFSGGFRVPNDLSGPYYLLVYADRDNAVFEGNETDNLAVAPQAVEVLAPPISDLAVGEITPPETGTAGEDATFTWEIINAGTEPVVGSWEDSIYLSADDQWDIDDTRVGSFKVPAVNLQPGQSTTVTVTAPIPGVLPGDYHVIVRTDIYNQMPETDETNNVGASTATVRTDVTPLQLGAPSEGALLPGRSGYYSLTTSANETVEIKLDAITSASGPNLYVAFEGIPTIGQFGFASEVLASPQQKITVPLTEIGTYYVLLNSQPGPTPNGTHYRIEAKPLPFGISGVSPSVVGAGVVTLILEGSGWTQNTTFSLIDSRTGALVAPQAIVAVSPAEARVRFDLSGANLGSFDIRAEDSSGSRTSVLRQGLTVEPAKPLSAAREFSGPAVVRRGTAASASLQIRNTSNIDIPYLVLQVLLPNRIGLTTTAAATDEDPCVVSYQPGKSGDFIPCDFYIENVSPADKINVPLVANTTAELSLDEAILLPATVRAMGRETFALEYVLGQAERAAWAARDSLVPDSTISDTDFGKIAAIYAAAAYRLVVDQGADNTSVQSAPGTAIENSSRSIPATPPIWAPTPPRPRPTGKCGVCKGSYQRCEKYCDVLRTGDFPCNALGFLPGIACRVAIKSCSSQCDDLLYQCQRCCKDPCDPWCPSSSNSHCAPQCADYSEATQSKCGYEWTWCTAEPYFELYDKNNFDPMTYGGGTWKCGKYECQTASKSLPGCIDPENAGDPNEKLGPFSSDNRSSLFYRIFFENIETAGLPASEVGVSDYLNDSLDIRSARIHRINIGGESIDVPEDRATFQERVALSGKTDMLIDITAGLDASKSRVVWTLRAVDPQTGEAPIDPEQGVLPPEDGTGRGQGWVEFSVKPKADVPVGTEIPNKATITFDYEEPITTNEWITTITAPTVPAQPATISVTPITQRNTTEGGVAARFEVVLDQAPTADVTVPLASLDPTEGTVTPAQLVFTPANWNTRQTATVTGVNDCAPDGNVAYQVQIGPATSTDAAYNGVAPASLDYTNLDNDPPATHPTLSVCNYTLVSTARYGRFDYDYTYRVELTNSGAAADSVTATLSSLAAKTRIVDGAVNFGPVGSDATVQSQDTFTIRQDRQYPFDPASLRWGFQTAP